MDMCILFNRVKSFRGHFLMGKDSLLIFAFLYIYSIPEAPKYNLT